MGKVVHTHNPNTLEDGQMIAGLKPGGMRGKDGQKYRKPVVQTMTKVKRTKREGMADSLILDESLGKVKFENSVLLPSLFIKQEKLLMKINKQYN